jgi:hypothetical protein
MHLSIVFFALLCAISVNTTAAETLPDSVESVAEALGFTPDERWRLYQGEIVAVDLPETSDKMLAQVVAMVIPASIDEIAVRLLRGNILETERDVIAFGRIDPAHIAASLENALFTAGDAEEVKMLQNGEFDEFNLSSSEIAMLKAAGKSSADAIAKTYRKILVERAKAYIHGGLASVDAYVRGKNKKTYPSRDLKAMTKATAILSEREPALYRAFLNYPKNQPAGVDSAFFWIKKRADKRPVFTLAHRLIQSRPDRLIIMRREFFVGHSFNAAQTVSGVFPAPQGSIIFSGNRATSDRVSGFAESLRHKIGRDMMREEIVKRFKDLRALYTTQ